jgi:tetratricopeptide (TPR) repeat protein
LRDLATDVINDPDRQLRVAAEMNERGRRLAALGRVDQAAAAYRTALTIQERLCASLPYDSNFFLPLAAGYCDFGQFEQGCGRLDACLPWYARAINTAQRPVPFRHSRQRDLCLINAYAGRAQALTRLNRHAQALKDWDQCVARVGEPHRTMIRSFRADTLVRLGQHSQAIAEAEELAGSARATATILYNSACVYALSAAAVPKENPLREQYADRAMELLGQATKTGFRDAGHIKVDRDLDVLRGRPDFKKLLAGLQELLPRPQTEPGRQP